MKTKVLVVGSGGNGQTYFIDFLKSNGIETNCNSDTDRLKHPSHPKNLINMKIDKCIFIYNDPLKSILSHFRRKWQHVQIRKLGNPYSLNKNTTRDIKKFLNLTAKKGRDIFGIEYQFNNWSNSITKFPVLYLKFNDVPKKKDVIDSFLGVKLDYTLFNIKERNSTNIIKSLKATDKNLCAAVHKIYKQLFIDIRQKAEEKNKQSQLSVK